MIGDHFVAEQAVPARFRPRSVIFAQSGCTSTATPGLGGLATSKRDRLLSGRVCPFPGWRLGVRLGFMTSRRRLQLTNHHPAVVEDLTKHAEQTQLRIADAITSGDQCWIVAGSVALIGFWC